MENMSVPLADPRPDCGRFCRAVLTDETPVCPPLVELRIDSSVAGRIILDVLGGEWVTPRPGHRPSQVAYWSMIAEMWYRLGYDCVRVEFDCRIPHSGFRQRPRQDDFVGQSRCYLDRAVGSITNWRQFRDYPWPTVGEVDLFLFEELSRTLPAGMGIMGSHEGGIFEHLVGLMGYEALSLRLYDEPGLVAAVAERLGDIMAGYYERLVKIDRVVAVFPSDDLAYAESTFLSPQHLRQYVLPWHVRFASIAHESGRPYFLHSCGRHDAIMGDLLDGVGLDARHGFLGGDDSPEQFKRDWGGRIGAMGGVPNSVLSDGSTDDVRRVVREVIDGCRDGGGFAIGSDFGITSDVQVDNFLAMLDEVGRDRR